MTMTGLEYLQLVPQQHYDAGQSLAAAQQGFRLGEGIEDRRDLAGIGLAYQQGGMNQARHEAFARGQPAIGIRLSAEQRERATLETQQLHDFISQANGLNDQQWNNLVAERRRNGDPIGPEWDGPAGRAQAIARGNNLLSRANLLLAQGKAAEAQASANLHNMQATTINAAPGHTIYGRQPDPNHPGGQVVTPLVTVPPLLTATDRRAIMESDDQILATQEVQRGLQRALQLSGQAFQGPGARLRGIATGTFGGAQGIATQQLEQVVNQQALSQLRTLFGAAPSEGERQILLELQGSVNQPRAVRDDIFRRALALAQRREAQYRQRGAEIRGQTFFQPGGGRSGSPGGPPGGGGGNGAGTGAGGQGSSDLSGLSDQEVLRRLLQQ